MTVELELLRKKIDYLDKQIVDCFEERMQTVMQVAAYKKEHNLPILNAEREREIIEKNTSMLQHKQYKRALESVLEKMMLVSRNAQQEFLDKQTNYQEFLNLQADFQNKIIGYQGVAGSFSQQTLQKFFQAHAILEKNYLNFEDVFKALQNEEIDYGVLPLENSTTGAISDIYDLLNKYQVCIVGEHCLEIEQALLAKPETTLEMIEKVYSHPQGFKQSREFLTQHSHWQLIPYFNTAKSAEYVANNAINNIAAIASKQAASLYNLKILQEKINFNNKNFTRFVILTKSKQIWPKSDKISLIISLPHKAGSLARVLNYFEEYNINLLKVESRPNHEQSWAYYFYIDFSGSLHDLQVQKVLKKVEADSSYFKLLGNYKEHKG